MMKRIKFNSQSKNSSICGNVKLARPLRFQYVTISKAFINVFTVLVWCIICHHDLTYVKKSGWTECEEMSIDHDLTNTAKSG